MTTHKDGVTLPALPKPGFYHYAEGVDMGVPAYTEHQMLAYALAALSVRAEPVAVKPLEWNEVETDRGDGHSDATGEWEASSIVGVYAVNISTCGDMHAPWEAFAGDYSKIGNFETLVDAKAAAQADYEQRIRSALVASPAPSIPAGYRLVPEEPTGEWLSRARHWIDRYAAGIDDEPQLDRIYSELPSAPAQQQEGDGE